MSLRKMSIICLVHFFLLTGCATTPPNKSNPKLQEIFKSTSSVMVIVLRADAYRMTAGGLREKVDEWCAQANHNLQTTAVEILGTRPVLLVKTLPRSMLTNADRINLFDTRALHDAVNASIPYFSGNRDGTYYDKVGNFDYSLGVEVAGLAKGADALLLISCIDVNPTSGREAVQAGTLLMTMPLILFGGTPVLLPGEFTLGSVSLVEAKSGTILWHKLYQSEAAHDLSSPLKTYELMNILLKDLPI
jgi:hypothetical protein